MSLNITEFDDTLKKLQRQVSQFASGEAVEIQKNNSILSKINFKYNIVYYILVPIIVIILYICKPCFIMTEITTTDVNLISITEKKLSLKRLIISTIICTCIIFLIIFCAKYKKTV